MRRRSWGRGIRWPPKSGVEPGMTGGRWIRRHHGTIYPERGGQARVIDLGYDSRGNRRPGVDIRARLPE